MEQFLTHLFGDYLMQPSWCALNKSKKSLNCFVHVLIYTACFLVLTTSWKALLVIGGTHFLLDRFHTPLKRLIWIREHLNPKFQYPPYVHCDTTGYYDDSPYNTFEQRQIINLGEGIKFRSMVGYKFPDWWGKPRHFFITIWLYIIIDNFFHLFINYMALKYLV